VNSITFENHDAYLLYQAALERNPDLPAHGSVSVQYALCLYYQAYPEERPKGFRYRQHNYHYLPVDLLLTQV